MMYLVTDEGIRFIDDDYKPITLDAALVTIRRVSAYIEAIGNEPERSADAAATVDSTPPTRDDSAASA